MAVYTQPDRPAGRGKKLQPSPVKQLAIEQGLPVLQPINFKEQIDREELANLNADLMIVVAYGLILPQDVLDTPKFGCINVHASLLPRWRGAAPIQRAIEAGDKESGVTIMQMDAGLDTGDMLITRACAINSDDTAESLHDRLIEVGRPALLESLNAIAEDQLSPVKQNSSAANYAHKIEKIEGLVDWNLDAQTLDRKIRAFCPFPVAYSLLNGERIKIHRAFVLESLSQAGSAFAGEIVQISDQGLDVQTAKGSIRIEQLQIPGKKAMAVADILRGYPNLFTTGQIFGSASGEIN